MTLESLLAALRASLLADVELRLNMTLPVVSEDYNAIWTIEPSAFELLHAGYLRLAPTYQFVRRSGRQVLLIGQPPQLMQVVE